METIIEKKLRYLDAQKEQLVANLNALTGAQQILRELLEELKAEEHSDE